MSRTGVDGLIKALQGKSRQRALLKRSIVIGCGVVLLSAGTESARGTPKAGATAASSPPAGTQAVSASSAGETKAALAMDVLGYLGRIAIGSGRSPFVDVPVTAPQYGYVQLALRFGMLKADAPHRFGAADPVTGANLAAAIAHLLGVPTSSARTAEQWIVMSQLLPATLLNSPITHGQVVDFFAKLSDWMAAQKLFPHSWTLPAEQSQLLVAALQSLTQVSTYQMTLNETQTGKLQLTPTGAANPAYAQVVAAEKPTSISTTIASILQDKQPLILMTIQQNPTAPSNRSTQVEYVRGNQVYVHRSTGWATARLSTADIATLQSLSTNLLAAGFTDVSATPQPDGATRFTATLAAATTTAALKKVLPMVNLTPTLLSKYLTKTTIHVGMLVSPATRSVQSESSSSGSAAGNGANASNVSNVSAARIVEQDIQFTISIPAQDFALLTGTVMTPAESTAFVQAVKEFDESVTETAAIRYDHVAIAAPTGLPSTSGSSSGSSSSGGTATG